MSCDYCAGKIAETVGKKAGVPSSGSSSRIPKEYEEYLEWVEEREIESGHRAYKAAVFGALGRLGIKLTDEQKQSLEDVIIQAEEKWIDPSRMAAIIAQSVREE